MDKPLRTRSEADLGARRSSNREVEQAAEPACGLPGVVSKTLRSMIPICCKTQERKKAKKKYYIHLQKQHNLASSVLTCLAL